MMYTNSLTSKGQITIPKALRTAIGLQPGRSARLELLDARTIAITVPVSGAGLRSLVGKPSNAQPLTASEKSKILARGL